nr:hypothetical protein [uncultured Methanoregula sp.]
MKIRTDNLFKNTRFPAYPLVIPFEESSKEKMTFIFAFWQGFPGMNGPNVSRK